MQVLNIILPGEKYIWMNTSQYKLVKNVAIILTTKRMRGHKKTYFTKRGVRVDLGNFEPAFPTQLMTTGL